MTDPAAATAIVRTPLLSATVGPRSVSRVDVREIRFAPAQQTGRHRHPCPVICYIAEGTALVEIEGEAPREYPVGTSVHEPADRIIARFDNSSTTEPLRFIAHYLLTGDEPLIEML